MKSKTFFTKQNLQWLGILLIFLALLVWILIIFSNRRTRKTYTYTPKPVYIEEIDLDTIGDEENIYESLDIKNIHESFKKSYLELVNNIYNREPKKNEKNESVIRVDINKDAKFYENYNKAKANYSKVLKRIESYEKDFKKKCYAKMRGIILGVLYADKKLKARVTKYDAKQLVEIGALDEVPVCPRGGEYSIIYKNGRRLFNCSVHGVLKQ